MCGRIAAGDRQQAIRLANITKNAGTGAEWRLLPALMHDGGE
jgi:hypothetical protein